MSTHWAIRQKAMQTIAGRREVGTGLAAECLACTQLSPVLVLNICGHLADWRSCPYIAIHGVGALRWWKFQWWKLGRWRTLRWWKFQWRALVVRIAQ
jgi:hypothetical protein